MKGHEFDPMDSIQIIRFLETFNMARDNKRTHGGPEMWLFPYFLGYFAAATLTPCLSLKAR